MTHSHHEGERAWREIREERAKSQTKRLEASHYCKHR